MFQVANARICKTAWSATTLKFSVLHKLPEEQLIWYMKRLQRIQKVNVLRKLNKQKLVFNINKNCTAAFCNAQVLAIKKCFALRDRFKQNRDKLVDEARQVLTHLVCSLMEQTHTHSVTHTYTHSWEKEPTPSSKGLCLMTRSSVNFWNHTSSGRRLM